MSRFLSDKYQSIAPYTPGEQPQDKKYIKLNTNESPYPPGPRVIEAVNRREARDLRLYSDPDLRLLTRAIANRYGLTPKQVLPTNGSDEVLAFAFQAYGGPERAMRFPSVSYSFYPVFARLYGVNAEAIPLQEGFAVDKRDYIGIHKDIVIANPNAPTGLALSMADMEEIAQSNPDNIVLVDEAYVDFGGESCVPLIAKYDNLIVVHTYSKSRNMAGARLGYAMANEELIADMNRIKFSFNPYNVNRLTTVAGIAAMEDDAYYKDCIARIVTTRQRTREALLALGFDVTDSKANFLFVRPAPIGGERYYMHLKERGVLVRHFSQKEIADWVRITIGTDEEMETLIEETRCMLDA